MSWNRLSTRTVNGSPEKISPIAGESCTGHGTGSVMSSSACSFIFSPLISNRETIEKCGGVEINFTTVNDPRSAIYDPRSTVNVPRFSSNKTLQPDDSSRQNVLFAQSDR